MENQPTAQHDRSPKALAGRAMTMVSLIIAGEAVFGLPFHITRYFRPTFVEVFGLSQMELGRPQAVYGFVAMFAYLAGGFLADRFPVRVLLAVSLVITGASGFYLATTPSLTGMYALYSFWGLSTILLFWAALIKATRAWGGDDEQGAAFGVLDGGRGFCAAVLSMIALAFFTQAMPAVGEEATREQQTLALGRVIATYTVTCFVAASFVWLFLPHAKQDGEASTTSKATAAQVLDVLKRPTIWLQALVVVAAYSMYKGTDYYSQFARDIWGWSEVEAARLSAMSTWARPLAAVVAGLLADRLCCSRVLMGAFLLSGVAYVAMVSTPPSSNMAWMLWASVLPGSLGVFAMRGVYFALLEESSIPPHVTGTACGLVSFIGFTPEIFMPLLGGWLIDRWSGGPTGYVALYGALAGVAVLGLLCSAALWRINHTAKQPA